MMALCLWKSSPTLGRASGVPLLLCLSESGTLCLTPDSSLSGRYWQNRGNSEERNKNVGAGGSDLQVRVWIHLVFAK